MSNYICIEGKPNIIRAVWLISNVLLVYRRRIKTEEKAKVVTAAAALAIFHQDDFEEKDEYSRLKATWRSGCIEKMDDHPVHTIPNILPT